MSRARRQDLGQRPWNRERRWRLRSRVVLAFAVGAALVSGALALITYAVARHELLAQRTSSSIRQTFANAHLVKQDLGAPSAQLADVLSSLQGTGGTESFIYRHGLWYGTSVSNNGSSLPTALFRSVLTGHVAEQRVVRAGESSVVVGVPLPAIGIDYFEVHPLGQLQGTVNLLVAVLGIAAAITTAGAVLAGLWASRRLVQPLTEAAKVATEVAGGSLDRRLPLDPDLHPLVSAFNEMMAALQDRVERDARFTSDVSHELRSPLTTIRASVELLDGYRHRLPTGGQQAVEALEVEVDRFSVMVQDLLEISRLDADATNLQLTDVPLDQLVRHVTAAWPGGVSFVVSSDARGVVVRGDKRRLQRVLANLLENAKIHAGGAVLVSLDRDRSWASISVEDHGPGIATEERDRLFERFYRGAASGRRGTTAGSGLGLALVSEHVHAHGGKVRIEDPDEGGARFVVSLPVWKD